MSQQLGRHTTFASHMPLKCSDRTEKTALLKIREQPTHPI